MDVSGDELAGVVDLFGWLTDDELGTAIAELAYKDGESYEPAGHDAAIESAIADYQLVALPGAPRQSDTDTPGEDGEVLVAGPAAFPTLPDGADDLVHIMDIDERTVNRDVARDSAVEQFRTDIDEALEADDATRIAHLVDVSYDLETWASVDLGTERNRLETA